MGLLAAVATSPLIPLALFFKKMIEKTFEGIAFAGFGFLITAAVLMLTAWLRRRDGAKGPAEMTWLDALLIGLAQMFAPLPGVSRSGLTIAAALALGAVANLGRRLQLADRRAGHSGSGCVGDEACRHWQACLQTASRQAVGGHDPRGGGRLFRDHLADAGSCDRAGSGTSRSTWSCWGSWCSRWSHSAPSYFSSAASALILRFASRLR